MVDEHKKSAYRSSDVSPKLKILMATLFKFVLAVMITRHRFIYFNLILHNISPGVFIARVPPGTYHNLKFRLFSFLSSIHFSRKSACQI